MDASDTGSPHVFLKPPPDTLAHGVGLEARLAAALPEGALFPMHSAWAHNFSSAWHGKASTGHMVRPSNRARGSASSCSASGEQQSVASPQAARGWGHPPLRLFKTQSCFCLGSAFE